MKRWEQIELDCFNYIKENYSSDTVSFEHKGFSDSNAPDIIASLSNVNKFNIEVKSASAQGGQFVVLDKNGKFVFSKDNNSPESIATPFIDYMNERYKEYQNPGSKGKKLDISQEEQVKWITSYYSLKGVKFFATKYKSKVVVCPISKIKEYFEVSCKYRVKPSGSSNIPKKSAKRVAELFNGNYLYDKKHFILSNVSLKLFDRIQDGNCAYYVSRQVGEGEFIITLLSKTENPNVIFTLKSKKSQDINDLQEFIEALKE